MSFLILYLRSRQIPMALAGAVGCVGALWVSALASERLAVEAKLGLFAVVGATGAAGISLSTADIDLDRSAAIAWLPRRAAHIAALIAAVIGVAVLTVPAGHELGTAGQFVRNSIGMGGLVALGAVTVGGSLAWTVPLTWTLLGLTLLASPWPADLATLQQVATWMTQPMESIPAAITAWIIGGCGVLAYAILGPGR